MALLITLALLVNLGVFVSYPMSGAMGFTFLYVSAVLWTALAFLIGHSTARLGLLPRLVITIIFALGCAFSGLSFLPQSDKVPAIKKFADGAYPDKRSVYLGLLRLGISVPALRPPQQPEAEVI
jgi:hypothetical protein